MDFTEQVHFMEAIELREQQRVPEWTHAECMEMSVSLQELWGYSAAAETDNHRLTGFFGRLRKQRNSYENN